MKNCSVDGCEKTTRKESLLCSMHYSRKQRRGDVGGPLPERVKSWNGELCWVDECNNSIKSKGYCSDHYDSLRNNFYDPQKIHNMKKNGCYVCGSFERLVVDHDHKCCPVNKMCDNCIRGILCHKCNTAAGLLDDDPNRMISLSMYIMSKTDVLISV